MDGMSMMFARMVGLKPEELQAMVQQVQANIQSVADNMKAINESLARIEARVGSKPTPEELEFVALVAKNMEQDNDHGSNGGGGNGGDASGGSGSGDGGANGSAVQWPIP